MSLLSPPLRLFAAGSLRDALTEIVASRAGTTDAPDMVFGPAGLLRERIEAGDVPDIFLSANMAHPAAIAAARPGTTPRAFARNGLVVIARRDLGLTTENFLDRLLGDDVRIGTSTPLADPSGDYAQQLFALADRMRPGAGARLDARARPLVGGRDYVPGPAGQSPARRFLEAGEVDAFVSYRSGATALATDFDIVDPPDEMRVSPVYGLVVLATQSDRQAAAAAFADDLFSPRAQAILARKGFQPPSPV